MKRWLTLLMVCGLNVATGCASGDDEEADPAAAIDCTTDMTTYNDVSAFDQCVICHSSALPKDKRMLAPEDINFDTPVAAKMTKAQKAAAEVDEGAMPPKSSGLTLTDAQKLQVYAWYKCGTKD